MTARNDHRIGHWIVLGVLGLLVMGTVAAYESYHDPALNDDGYCASCHPGFGGGRSDTTHAIHTGGGDPVTGNCNLCHTGSGRNNPLIMWSTGDGSANSELGCAGCHGRDYGETTTQDYNGLPSGGQPKHSGYGLRKQHLNDGVTVCLDCHADVPQSFIEPETTPAAYYGRSDVSLGGAPVDPCNNEDSGNDADAAGLDNDGDTDVDGTDTDCSGGGLTPGEASDPLTQQLIVTGKTATTLSFTYGAACSATDNNIEYGDLLALSAPITYSGQECAIGNAGSYTWDFSGVPNQSFFFLVVANDGAVEGSYGVDSALAERPEDTTSAACPIPQDLASRCD